MMILPSFVPTIPQKQDSAAAKAAKEAANTRSKRGSKIEAAKFSEDAS